MVHCRSYIPARVGLALKRRFGVRFLFDMRGFWPDEKVEGNNWNLANPLYAAVYRYFKRLESRLLRGADHIVSLTEAGQGAAAHTARAAGRGPTDHRHSVLRRFRPFPARHGGDRAGGPRAPRHRRR